MPDEWAFARAAAYPQCICNISVTKDAAAQSPSFILATAAKIAMKRINFFKASRPHVNAASDV
jgi:hypothetical protein